MRWQCGKTRYLAQGSSEQHNHSRMSLVIEAEVLIHVNPHRQDRPKLGDIAERRDGVEGERLRKNEVSRMVRQHPCRSPRQYRPNRTGDFILQSVTLGRDRENFYGSKECQAPLPKLTT